MKGKRGDGPNSDSFSLSMFFEDLLARGLDYAIYPLFLYRVGADHYILNPTRVVLLTKPWKGREEDVEINVKILDRILELSYEILEELEKY
ncbi:MAG: hypothetical protein F7B17_01250 [Desulfurococcales archaeon]|nr:hypothetical protein [Desulfurococcales archaeon]